MDNHFHQHHMSSMDSQAAHMYPNFAASSASGTSAASSSSATMSSPVMSQSPETQLSMHLLNNFLNMQGLGDSIIQQQLGAGAVPLPPSQARPPSPRNSTASSPNFSATSSNLLMEQQIKLTQLQQLQQLQNQIFQQQIALISGQSPAIQPSPSLAAGLPLDVARTSARGADASSKHTPADGGMYLPTPGPSGEIRPQQLDFNVSPNNPISNFMEPLPHALVPPPVSNTRDSSRSNNNDHNLPPLTSSSGVPLNLNLQRQLLAISQHHRAISAANNNHNHDSFPSSPVYHPTSPMHHPVSPMHESPNPFGQQQQSHSHHRQSSQQYPTAQGHPSQPHNRIGSLSGPHTMPHSAPERVAFNIYNGTLPGGGQIPGLTLGPAGVPLDGMEGNGQSTGSSSGGSSGHPHHYSSGRRGSVSETSAGGLHAPHRQVHHLQTQSYHGQGHGNMQMPVLDQDISPLTSPWLGAHPTSSSSSSTSHPHDGPSIAGPSLSGSGLRHEHRASVSMNHSNKRMASSSGDEGGSARKKQSPAIRPTIGMSIARLVGNGGGGGGGERERDSGSTSPLALNERRAGKMRVGAGGGGDGREDAEKRAGGSSWSSASASGSVSPDPTRACGAAAAEAGEDGGMPSIQQQQQQQHRRTGSFAVGDPGAGGGNANNNNNHNSNLNLNSGLEANNPASNVTTHSFRPYRGSKSTNSTPLLRSTPSSALALGMSSMGTGGGARNAGNNTGRTRSKSRPGSVPMHASVPDVHDSPSPVDLNADRSMPPPPLPPGRQADETSHGPPGGNGGRRVDDDASGDVNASTTANANANVDANSGMDGMMGMEGVLSDMNFSNMMNNINALGDGMGGMDMGMNMNMGVNMEMDMGMGVGVGVGMEGMGMSNFSGNMGSMDMMNMDGMDFAQDGSHHHHEQQRHQQQQDHHAEHHQQQQQSQQQQPMVPVTPASIMNLGRLGISSSSGSSGRLGSASAHAASTGGASGSAASGSGTTPTKKGGRKEGLTRGVAAASGATRSTRTSMRNKVVAIANTISPSLKPLLPAHTTPNMDATLPSPQMPGAIVAPAGPVMQVRKTSHKAAEQKRRDSLKTTFDDLRKLLPPIALANDPDIDPNLITSPLFHATTPLLPGALPPRGPPKAGSDGPNKGVSKLQLLICGNEYIRLLTKRVERRDDEIEQLRREVRRLRVLVENKGEDADDEDGREGDRIDLEKDLDAVERVNMGAGQSSNTAESSNNASNDPGPAEDAMDEADDDADD